jgi:hypothetical protein
MKVRLIALALLLVAAHLARATNYVTLANGKHCVVGGAPTADYPTVCTDAEYQAGFSRGDPNDPKVYARMLMGYVHSPIEMGASISRSVSPLLFDQAMSALRSAHAGPCISVSGMTYDRATRTINIQCNRATHTYYLEVSDGTWLVSVLK